MIDAHQHFWRLDRGDYGWLTPGLGVLHRDYGPDDLAPLLAQASVTRTIAVQAAETVAETRWLLSLAEAHPWVAGVVGWADLAAPDAPSVIADFARAPKLKGLRPMLHDMADDEWLLGAELVPVWAAMAAHGLRLDALVRPRDLPVLRRFLERRPGLPVVIDHGAKPDIAGGGLQAWAAEIQALARDHPDVCCKLSGLVTEAGRGWSVEELRPYADALLEAFGPPRLMWGSDWPVVRLASEYGEWRAASLALLSDLGEAERAQVLGGTAARFYGLETA